MQKSTGEAAAFMKSLLPHDIPEAYPIKPVFGEIAGFDAIRGGVLAFREFLYILYDRLTEDGDLYPNPQRDERELNESFYLTGKYPFIGGIINVLNEIGLNGVLSENGGSIFVADWTTLATTANHGHVGKVKIPLSKIIEALKFLTYCGMDISGIDFDAKKPGGASERAVIISYPDNNAVLIGLKTLAVAQNKLKTYDNDDFLPRCCFEALIDGERDILFQMKNHLYPLPPAVQNLVIQLHKQCLSDGFTCKLRINSARVKYIYSRSSRVVWAFSISLYFGYCILVKAINTHKYAETIEKFHPLLRQVINKGYGCYRKTGGTYCNGNCQGMRLTLDDSILNCGDDIKIWLKKEVNL
ncbi:MAG: hypothetical protein LBS21_01010 [Clostridiales bacterium]|jgi:hypothetical protein|nr:hypothetical protein [Clostridiales bacterium]